MLCRILIRTRHGLLKLEFFLGGGGGGGDVNINAIALRDFGLSECIRVLRLSKTFEKLNLCILTSSA